MSQPKMHPRMLQRAIEAKARLNVRMAEETQLVCSAIEKSVQILQEIEEQSGLGFLSHFIVAYRRLGEEVKKSLDAESSCTEERFRFLKQKLQTYNQFLLLVMNLYGYRPREQSASTGSCQPKLINLPSQ